MLRTILTSLFFFGLSTACKMLPHSIRSELKGEEVYGLLEQGSIRFARATSGTSGDLTFTLKGPHSCHVEYWADDPNGKPSPGSPLGLDCPNDGQATSIKLAVANITVGVPLTFRITVWPKALNALSGFPLEFHEARDLGRIQTGHLVIARYVAPRNSNEIYTFQLPKVMNLAEVKAKLSADYNQDETVQCSEEAGPTDPPFPRILSGEDAQKRALHGLSEVSTDGYGRAAATPHPFFATRLVQVYESVERSQNWTWNFKWEGTGSSFESFPPGYIANVSLLDADGATVNLKNRALGNALPEINVSSKSFRLTPSILYPTEISRFILILKAYEKDKPIKTVLRCQYSIDQDGLTIPDAFYQKLAEGKYLGTFMFETNQIHYKEDASYPPWLITAQDWVYFEINKKL